MNVPVGNTIRVATPMDCARLVHLWASVFDEDDSAAGEPWRTHARAWFARNVGESSTARLPLIEVEGDIVATAIGTLELGVPNPQCRQGRTVRLANVITVPEHRGHGHGTRLVQDVVEWARSIDADRVDLSSTRDGQRIYEKAGFVYTSAPRMKYVL
jgi:GNAT superfamily N-acetyltransferase